MAYATLEQLCKQYGYREISELLSDELAQLTEAMLLEAVAGDDLTSYTAEEQLEIVAALERANDALNRQSSFMDSKIAVRYRLPILQTVIDISPLPECCLALTRAYLADDGDNVSQMIESSRTRWIKWLCDLAKDATVISGAIRIDTGGTEKQYLTATPTKGLDLTHY